MEPITISAKPDESPASQQVSPVRSPFKTILQDKILVVGWGLLTVSAALFVLPALLNMATEKAKGLFIIHFLFSVIYFLYPGLNKHERVQEHRLHYQFIKLVLFLISAYALNREMEVFAASPLWFSIVLVTSCVSCLAAVFFQVVPDPIKQGMMMLWGLALVVFIYLSIYLMPLYPISVMALPALGISVHSFVPLFFVIALVMLLSRVLMCRYLVALATGLAFSIGIVIAFSIVWHNSVTRINNRFNTAMADGEDRLPLWVQAAQQLKEDAVTEALLKGDLMYKIPDWDMNGLFSMPRRTLNEQQPIHDPLVVIASAFSKPLLLSEEDRLKILESQYGARHQTLERLWSGDALKTSRVTTSIKLWPQWRLAYTEKLITVQNEKSTTSWQRQGEGIYTFHLPEGGVVTSLSLWINGKEEKGILTSKQTATTAYKTIVGVESRDPSVVHWQEGNTVSVRVFPIMAGSNRAFKIGVTAPLTKEGDQMIYDNIWFEGPAATEADELVRLEVMQGETKAAELNGFTASGARQATRSGRYQARWKIALPDKGIAANSFAFNGQQYSIKPYQQQRIATTFTDVYLDVNRAWTEADVDAALAAAAGKKVWVYNGEIRAVSAAEKSEWLPALQEQAFSLFPFQLVQNKEQSLVVTKSAGYSPNITDLEGSPFLKGLQSGINDSSQVSLFHLGTDFTPFIRSLKERRCFRFEYGNGELLSSLLKKGEFIHDVETDNKVIVHSAEAVITKEPVKAGMVANAPDHLMRLFAYNHVMKSIGTADSTSKVLNEAAVKEAEEAYVVTPVSSLIVLETQADYDRFGIKESESSLKNASLKNKGAVPEPHEWAIIILFAITFLFILHKTKLV